MPSTIIAEFIRALDEEIEAIKKGKGGSLVKVFNGRFLRQFSELYLYAFNLENFLAVLDDSPADIEIRGVVYSAQVLVVHGLEVEIGIDSWCGPFIPEARLQTGLWKLLEKLKKKYNECQSGSLKPDFHLSDLLFSSQPSASATAPQTNPRYSQGFEKPNEAQGRAIEASFHSTVCVIWGPPGTGKTKTIARAYVAIRRRINSRTDYQRLGSWRRIRIGQLYRLGLSWICALSKLRWTISSSQPKRVKPEVSWMFQVSSV